MEEGITPALCVNSPRREKIHTLRYLEVEKHQVIGKTDRTQQTAGRRVTSNAETVGEHGKRESGMWGRNDTRDVNSRGRNLWEQRPKGNK